MPRLLISLIKNKNIDMPSMLIPLVENKNIGMPRLLISFIKNNICMPRLSTSNINQVYD